MDSDILTNLKTAIMTKFNAVDGGGDHNSFFNAVQGKLFYGRAPEGTEFPYSVFQIITHNMDRTFTEDNRDLLVQFSHFSADMAASDEAEIINAYCNALFDECAAFTIAGAKLLWMKLNNSPGAQPEDFTTPSGTESGWCCSTNFDVRISMN